MSKNDKEFLVMTPITIPAGSTLKRAPDKTLRYEPHYSVLLQMGKDHCAELIFPESALADFPGKFIIRQDGVDIIEPGAPCPVCGGKGVISVKHRRGFTNCAACYGKKK